MRVSELFVKCLENEGVEYIFGVPGEENIDFLDALKESDIEFITTRHETGAAFMAGYYGKLTGKPGVCLATLGPGATNLLTGVASANMDHSPLIAITGQAGMNRQHKQSHQYYDLVSMFKPVTKWNTSIRDQNIVPEVVRKAFQTATSEKPGAVHIELPEDISALKLDEGKPIQAPQNQTQSRASNPSIQHVSELLNQAKQPIIVAGNGVTRQHASDALLAFVEKLKAPITSTFMGKGAITWEHPQNLQTIGLQENDPVVRAIEECDIIIAVGFDMTEFPPSAWNPEGKKPIIHIDTAPAEIDAAYPVKESLVGDISTNLFLLTEKIEQRESMNEFYKELREELINELHANNEQLDYPMKPQKIVSDLREVMGEDDILISDVGSHKMWIARHYHCINPDTCLISNGFASMGVAVPGAIGAKLAKPHQNVVAVAGDGGFVMTAQELETMVRLNLPIVVVVLTDNRYGLIEKKQMNEFERSSNITFENPDFIQLAKAYGVEGLKVLRAEEFKPIMEEALKMGKPVLVDCPIDYKENFRISE
ncbi:acetolactate synthase large subunit [Pseudalkalibacillus berkeleyi]|uniref:Acetolactate synthase large subunit n=1 Tax=Pseudalkalibacillus berkeleyi TaxID=1069813 RepID=A0ABS9H5P4_9BACL|nr:acetolactate synthase large subunit [Pseudalkalibacillus berkeleyi]MCF6139290.1 acetolactate synthase large subunit [Pseudalkalibacillus berkeleyi]